MVLDKQVRWASPWGCTACPGHRRACLFTCAGLIRRPRACARASRKKTGPQRWFIGLGRVAQLKRNF
jgi:hypothetical protein